MNTRSRGRGRGEKEEYKKKRGERREKGGRYEHALLMWLFPRVRIQRQRNQIQNQFSINLKEEFLNHGAPLLLDRR